FSRRLGSLCPVFVPVRRDFVSSSCGRDQKMERRGQPRRGRQRTSAGRTNARAASARSFAPPSSGRSQQMGGDEATVAEAAKEQVLAGRTHEPPRSPRPFSPCVLCDLGALPLPPGRGTPHPPVAGGGV